MKKISYIIVCFFFIVSFINATTNKIPEIEFENAFIVDLNNYKITSISTIKLQFYANNPNTINVYAYNTNDQKWEFQEQLILRGFSDKCSKTFSNSNIANYKFFALVPENNKQYAYNIDKVFNGALYIEIRPENSSFDTVAFPKINLENSTVFKIDSYKADDSLIIINNTNNEDLICIPYYFNSKKFKWERSIETAKFNTKTKLSKLEVKDHGIENINFLSLEVTPYDIYNYFLYEKNDDLYIEISNYIESENFDKSKDINYIEE